MRTGRLGLLRRRRFPQHSHTHKPVRADFSDPFPYPPFVFPVGKHLEPDLVRFGHERTGDRDHFALAVVLFDDGLVLREDEGDRLEEGGKEGGEVGRRLACTKTAALINGSPCGIRARYGHSLLVLSAPVLARTMPDTHSA